VYNSTNKLHVCIYKEDQKCEARRSFTLTMLGTVYVRENSDLTGILTCP